MASAHRIGGWQREEDREGLDRRSDLDVAGFGGAGEPPRFAETSLREVCRLAVDACKAATPAARSLMP